MIFGHHNRIVVIRRPGIEVNPKNSRTSLVVGAARSSYARVCVRRHLSIKVEGTPHRRTAPSPPPEIDLTFVLEVRIYEIASSLLFINLLPSTKLHKRGETLGIWALCVMRTLMFSCTTLALALIYIPPSCSAFQSDDPIDAEQLMEAAQVERLII